MRLPAIVFSACLIGVLAGCSGGAAPNPTPTSLTPEEQRLMDEAQQKAADDERAQRKSNP